MTFHIWYLSIPPSIHPLTSQIQAVCFYTQWDNNMIPSDNPWMFRPCVATSSIFQGSLLGSLPMAERTAKGSVSWSSFCSNPQYLQWQLPCFKPSPWHCWTMVSRADITERYTNRCHCSMLYNHYVHKWHVSIRSYKINTTWVLKPSL